MNKQAHTDNDGASELRFGTFDGGRDGGNIDLDFVRISSMTTMQKDKSFIFVMIHFMHLNCAF